MIHPAKPLKWTRRRRRKSEANQAKAEVDHPTAFSGKPFTTTSNRCGGERDFQI
jgi:hypothetical protein